MGYPRRISPSEEYGEVIAAHFQLMFLGWNVEGGLHARVPLMAL